MKILVTTGMPGSGKEELLNRCIARGAKVIRMGDMVRDKAKEFGLDLSDSSVGSLADEERKRYGMDIWAKRTIPFVGGDLVAIDGTRGPDEIKAFKKAFGDDLVVVAVHTSPRTRYARLKSRGRPDSPSDFVEFELRDKRELEWGLGDAIALADHMIINEGTLDELTATTDALLDGLLRKE